MKKLFLLLGRNVLQLFNIRETRNFTCVAASKLGMIETQSTVKVQGENLLLKTFTSNSTFYTKLSD